MKELQEIIGYILVIISITLYSGIRTIDKNSEKDLQEEKDFIFKAQKMEANIGCGFYGKLFVLTIFTWGLLLVFR